MHPAHHQSSTARRLIHPGVYSMQVLQESLRPIRPLRPSCQDIRSRGVPRVREGLKWAYKLALREG
eukprot:3049802-Amphidinium_carterae.1